jgi:hypothetical protein
MTEGGADNQDDRVEFIDRFVAHIKARAGGGEDILQRAKQTAPTYWDDLSLRAEGPEECAETDIAYWAD